MYLEKFQINLFNFRERSEKSYSKYIAENFFKFEKFTILEANLEEILEIFER